MDHLSATMAEGRIVMIKRIGNGFVDYSVLQLLAARTSKVEIEEAIGMGKVAGQLFPFGASIR